MYKVTELKDMSIDEQAELFYNLDFVVIPPPSPSIEVSLE